MTQHDEPGAPKSEEPPAPPSPRESTRSAPPSPPQKRPWWAGLAEITKAIIGTFGL